MFTQGLFRIRHTASECHNMELPTVYIYPVLIFPILILCIVVFWVCCLGAEITEYYSDINCGNGCTYFRPSHEPLLSVYLHSAVWTFTVDTLLQNAMIPLTDHTFSANHRKQNIFLPWPKYSKMWTGTT